MAIAFCVNDPKPDEPFDISWMSVIPALDSRGFFTETGPGFKVTPPQLYCYYTPVKGEQSPLRGWNGIVIEINARLAGPYVNSESLVNISANQDFTMPLLTRSRRWNVSDILMIRDIQRVLNPHISFLNLTRVWSSNVVMDLLQLRWVRRVDNYSTSFGQKFSFDSVSQLSGFVVSSNPATAIYEFDMGTGLGSQLHFWLAPNPPTPDKLLAMWAKEDAPKDGAPKMRGTVTSTMIDGGFINAIPSGNSFTANGANATFSFSSGLGGIVGGSPGANIQDGGSSEGGNGGGAGRD